MEKEQLVKRLEGIYEKIYLLLIKIDNLSELTFDENYSVKEIIDNSHKLNNGILSRYRELENIQEEINDLIEEME